MRLRSRKRMGLLIRHEPFIINLIDEKINCHGKRGRPRMIFTGGWVNEHPHKKAISLKKDA